MLSGTQREMGRTGRKRKPGARFPSGDIRTEPQDSPEKIALRQPHRRDAPLTAKHDQRAETPFGTLNLIGAIVWAIAFASVGYGLGEAASQLFIEDFKRYGLYLLGGLVLVGFLIWLVTLVRHRRKAREHGLK